MKQFIGKLPLVHINFRAVRDSVRSIIILLTGIFFLVFFHSDMQAQEQVSLDWKVHDVGKVRQVVTNHGALWRGATSYPGLLYSEFPPGSFEEHIGEAGLWIGDVTARGDTLVSVADSWSSPFEFYPTGAPWDTVQVVRQGDTVDIPYLTTDEYTALSDQDFIVRYNDYGSASLQVANHNPLYLEIIERSYAWSSPPLDEFILFRYQVMPVKNDLDSAYVNFFMDANVGWRTQGWDFALDDYSTYDADTHTGYGRDAEGGPDGNAVSDIANRIYLPENVDEEQLDWRFYWYSGQGTGGVPGRDAQRFQNMSSGIIQSDQQRPVGAQYSISFGPVSVAVGDTLDFFMAQVYGEGEERMQNNLDLADFVIERDFQLPSAPPSPRVEITTRNREVEIKWGNRAESYRDPNRSDSVEQPFEGYRVYKSTNSRSGPWTLLAEYDREGNEFGQNTGIKRDYLDSGLMNNVEYYYAVTAFSKPDTVLGFPSQETSTRSNSIEVVPGTEPPDDVGEVAVVPNPYRGDMDYNSMAPPWERPPETRERWLEQDRRIQFIRLPTECTIKIYTLSGRLVETLEHNDPQKGFENWNLTSNVNQAVASGIYLFTVKNHENGNTQTGKFVIIK